MEALLIWDRLIQVFALSGRLVARLFPYVLVGVLIGEVLKHARWTRLIQRGCSRRPAVALLWAALLGMVSPLCMYGTVPIILQLARSGTPVFPLITFLSVSSLMNPQLFIITWRRGIGLEIAFARVAAVFAYEILLGFALWRLLARWIVNPRVLDSPSQGEDLGPAKRFGWKGFLRASWRSSSPVRRPGLRRCWRSPPC